MEQLNVSRLLTDYLIAVIQADHASMLTLSNELKSVGDLTPDQRQLIDSVDSKGYSTLSKATAIKLLAGIAGLNSSTQKLEGGDKPISLDFKITYHE